MIPEKLFPVNESEEEPEIEPVLAKKPEEEKDLSTEAVKITTPVVPALS